MEYHKYIYKGPVYMFDRLIADQWEAETMAKSERKAKTNVTYQFKKDNHILPGTKISLPGKITMVE